MPEPIDSGERQAAPRNGSTVREWAVKVAAGVVIAVLLGTSTMLLAHEGQLKVLETQRKSDVEARKASDKALKDTLGEMKNDIKTLLRRQQ